MFKRSSFILIIGIYCTLFSLPALADDKYINISAGQFAILDVEPGIEFPIKALGLTVTWGQSFGEYSGVESKLFISQSASSGGITMNTSGYAVYYNPHIELIDNLSIHIPVGISFVSFDRTVSGYPKEKGRSFGFSYGAGLGYSIGDKLSVTMDWLSYLNGADVGAPGVDIKLSISSLMAGITYQF